LNSTPKKSGYICVPYQHDKFSIDVKDMWISSRNVKSIYFVTATFSDECKPYFPFSTNHYLLAKFDDEEKLVKMRQNLLILNLRSFLLLTMSFLKEILIKNRVSYLHII